MSPSSWTRADGNRDRAHGSNAAASHVLAGVTGELPVALAVRVSRSCGTPSDQIGMVTLRFTTTREVFQVKVTVT
ncbi:hypothetical protein ASZ90_014573 [hydrocarbon metagenome]|uniref:Uncharacterized protein n=1 Tax=hydrocarbon metagenome TaxID=938273 RepID=A0A0W8F4I3_9ZZZZ